MKTLLSIIILILSFICNIYGENMKEPYLYGKSGVRTYFGKDSLLGLEDVKGNKLTPAIYTEMGTKHWGNKILVEVENKYYGIIDIAGNTILTPNYIYIRRYDDEITIDVKKDKNEEQKLEFNNKKGIFEVYTPKAPKVDSLELLYDTISIIGHYKCGGRGSCVKWEKGNYGEIEHTAICGDGWGCGFTDTLAYQAIKNGKNYILSKDKKTILTEGIFKDARDRNNIYLRHDTFLVHNNDTLISIDSKNQKIIDKQTYEITFEKEKRYNTITSTNKGKIKYECFNWWPLQFINELAEEKKFIILKDDYYAIQEITKVYKGNYIKKGVIQNYPASYHSHYCTDKIIIPFIYDDIKFIAPDKYQVRKKEKYGIYSINGEVIEPCKQWQYREYNEYEKNKNYFL